MAVRSEAAYPVGWKNGRVASWLVTVDHKRIGILYIATSLVWFVAGGILALLMRGQLATPNEAFLTKNSYNEVMTMHGTTMIFLVVIPILAGFANFLVPLMIGARDMAFPRLNALSYWLFVLGGIVLWLSWFSKGGAAHAGWWSYPTLSENFPFTSPGHGQDYWILSIHILTLSSLLGAINFIVTIHNMRAPGMTWMRMPLFVWAIETYAILLLAGAAGALGGGDAAAARPHGRDALLHPVARRQHLALPAHVLVLRAPRGLHHGAARLRDDLGDHPGLLAQADLRLQGGRVLDPRRLRSSRCSSGRTTCSRRGWGPGSTRSS